MDELTIQERRYLLQKVGLEAWQYESHELLGHLTEGERKRLHFLRALYDKLKGDEPSAEAA